jgi:hypothetical protein
MWRTLITLLCLPRVAIFRLWSVFFVVTNLAIWTIISTIASVTRMRKDNVVGRWPVHPVVLPKYTSTTRIITISRTRVNHPWTWSIIDIISWPRISIIHRVS